MTILNEQAIQFDHVAKIVVTCVVIVVICVVRMLKDMVLASFPCTACKVLLRLITLLVVPSKESSVDPICSIEEYMFMYM